MFGVRKVKYETLRKYVCHLNDHARANARTLTLPGLCHSIAKNWRKREKEGGHTPSTGKAHDTHMATTTTGFFGVARLGELVGKAPPQWSELVKDEVKATLFLQRSKMDLNKCGAPLSVPINIWRKVEALVGGPKASGPIFAGPDGTAYSKHQYNKWLVASLKLAGYPPTAGVIGHSLRRGGAQYLWDCGLSLEEIRVKGRWSSDAWRKYINLNSRVDSKIAALSLAFNSG
jgi:hypothetical protein